MRIRAQVGIIGAGPAGLALANSLEQLGISTVVLEKYSRAHVESRARAGLIEHRTVAFLDSLGLSGRLRAEGVPHASCEFRYRGESFSIPYGELAGGYEHYVYPQQFLVRDLADAYLERGGRLYFSHPVTGVDVDSAVISAQSAADGAELVVECDFVAGCDGFHGVSRQAVPAERLGAFSKRYEFGWLAVLAQAPPSTKEIVYALHEDGFAGHMLRTPTVSRYYLQCPVGDSADNWSDARIWEALERRLAVPGWELSTGPVIEKAVLDMRSYVAERMDHRKLFLVGDSAHIITPAGGKGMNLAIADAQELAAGLRAHYADGESGRLAGYSATCLSRVWQAQEFSHWMLQLLHAPEPGSGEREFMHRLQLSRLSQLRSVPSYAAMFANSYVGVV
ncbi:p-hydroxybenzoate 3-monooxygenase [Kitasatospora sp. MAP5-34]|nr:p-hydroxybenzoate 3-monooxygenase [Kitasatospora sp. MAP5-34]